MSMRLITSIVWCVLINGFGLPRLPTAKRRAILKSGLTAGPVFHTKTVGSAAMQDIQSPWRRAEASGCLAIRSLEMPLQKHVAGPGSFETVLQYQVVGRKPVGRLTIIGVIKTALILQLSSKAALRIIGIGPLMDSFGRTICM